MIVLVSILCIYSRDEHRLVADFTVQHTAADAGRAETQKILLDTATAFECTSRTLSPIKFYLFPTHRSSPRLHLVGSNRDVAIRIQ